MARQRMISPKYFADEDLAGVTFPARLLGLALLTMADREGRLEDRPKLLKVGAFPHDVIEVAPLLEELVQVRFLVRYVVNGRAYLLVRSFHRYQKPHPNEARSTLPGPPSSVVAFPADVTRPSDISGSAQAEYGVGVGVGEPPQPPCGGRPDLPDDIHDGRIVVMATLLADEYRATEGTPDRYWMRRTKQALRDRGMTRGAEFVRAQIAREQEARGDQREQDQAAGLATRLVAEARAGGRDGRAEWAALYRQLEQGPPVVNAHSLGTWFRPLQPLGIIADEQGDRLLLGAPNDTFVTWLERNYRETVAAAARAAGLVQLVVWFVVQPQEQLA